MKSIYMKSMLMIGVAATAMAAFGARTVTPSAQLADPLEWLYPDSQVGSVRTLEIVDVPANGVLEANVLLNGLDPDKPLSFACNVPAGEWFRYVAVAVPLNTGIDGATEKRGSTNNVYVTRLAPFWVYDAMEPVAGGSVKPGAATAALRFRLREFRGPGVQNVKLAVSQGKFRKTFTLRVNVHSAKVPPVGRDSFKYTNWIDFHAIAICHGVKTWSEEHYKLIEDYIRLAVYGRQNMVRLPDFRKNYADSSPDCNEEAYIRLVALLMREGVWYLEGPHLCRYSAGNYMSPAFIPGGWSGTNLTTSIEGSAYLARRCQSLYAMIRKNGWADRWYQHVADEPNRFNAEEYRMTCGIVRKYMPGIRLADAVESPVTAGALDVFCPQNYRYEKSRAECERFRMCPTDEIWCYTCMFPGGRWLNRLLDQEVMRPVLMGWGCFCFGLEGYLHWGYNQYRPKTDPLKLTLDSTEKMQEEDLPFGDRNIVYAGKSGPWPSVRLEAMRQGFEDVELLKLLASRDKAKADTLTKKLVRGFHDYEMDPAVYRAVRHELLTAVDLLKNHP